MIFAGTFVDLALGFYLFGKQEANANYVMSPVMYIIDTIIQILLFIGAFILLIGAALAIIDHFSK